MIYIEFHIQAWFGGLGTWTVELITIVYGII